MISRRSFVLSTWGAAIVASADPKGSLLPEPGQALSVWDSRPLANKNGPALQPRSGQSLDQNVPDPTRERDGTLLLVKDGALEYSRDLTLPTPVLSGDGTVHDGIIRRAQSIRIPWAYGQAVNPSQPEIGTALLVDANVTVMRGGAFGPNFQTSYFGPRGIIDLEGLVRYDVNMTPFGFAPVGYYDALTIANTAGVARNLAPSWSYLSARSIVADGADCTLVGTDVNRGGAAFVDSAVYGSVDCGRLNGLTNDYELVSFFSMPGLFGNVQLARRIGLDVRGSYEGVHPNLSDPDGPHWSGVGNFDPTDPTLNEEIGVRVQQFSLGRTKIGVQSVHPIVADEGFFGGRDAADNLVLGSTLHSTKGRIDALDRVRLLPNGLTNLTSNPVRLLEWQLGQVTLNDQSGGFLFGNELTGLMLQGTVVFRSNAGVLGSGNVVSAALTLKNPTGQARTITRYTAMTMQAAVQADGAVLTSGGTLGLLDNPQFAVVNSGTLNASEVTAVHVQGGVASGATVATRRGLRMLNPHGTGAVTTLIGVDIEPLTRGGTNIGIRNASTEVAVPSVATLPDAGTAVTPNAKLKRLHNTSGGALILTSTPTIANGQNGQLLVLFNSSALPITLQDHRNLTGSNLRLEAGNNVTLAQGDSLLLLFSSDIGDWIQMGHVAVAL
jgi:hypothetical protein